MHLVHCCPVPSFSNSSTFIDHHHLLVLSIKCINTSIFGKQDVHVFRLSLLWHISFFHFGFFPLHSPHPDLDEHCISHICGIFTAGGKRVQFTERQKNRKGKAEVPCVAICMPRHISLSARRRTKNRSRVQS